MEPLIIECALNEQATQQQNPNVPIAPDDIVRDALEAARAGAAIVHLHARDARSGDMLHPGTECYREIFRRSRARPGSAALSDLRALADARGALLARRRAG